VASLRAGSTGELRGACEQPPLHLLPGATRCVAREKLDAVIDEMDRWEEVTRGTDFPQEKARVTASAAT
jgi:hypothetical protein